VTIFAPAKPASPATPVAPTGPVDAQPWPFTPRGELAGAIAAGALLLAGFVLHVALKLAWAESFMWASLAIGMVFGARAALDALRDRRVDIDVLMVVGAGLAAAIGHPEEGALLLFLFTLSGALEALAMERTQREVRALHALLPKAALVFREGAWIEADAESLTPGETVKIRPGERVPVDCQLTRGASSIDQSTITGESMPRAVKEGDELFAGTVNTDDPLEARVLRGARESSLQKILDLVTKAREQREPMQQLIDRLSQPYTLFVFAISIAVLLVWWRVLGVPLMGEDPTRGALYTAITLLIVASPCALIIATPTATLAGIARSARAGVLFKGGDAMDRLARVGAVCLDKTGTLTLGRPRLYEVHPVAWSDGPALLAIAAGLEADSTHPIAQAIREAAAQRGVTPAPIDALNHIIAQGIEGRVTIGGRSSKVRLGRLAFVESSTPVCLRARVRELLSRIQERGHIGVVVVRWDQDNPEAGEAAVLIMADAIRAGAPTLAAELLALDVRPIRMLTGDNKLTAQRVASSLKLDAFDAELMPGDKLRIVGDMRREAKARGRGVAVIGDGVNDAPALAAADLGMAIGNIGTAAALESADVVLLSDSLATVPWSIRLARRVRATVRTNLAIALTIIVLMGLYVLIASRTDHPASLALGVVAHEGGTLLVVMNSLRILAFPGVRSRLA
jgi:Cd2+/Zn2+-exporting ATPase